MPNALPARPSKRQAVVVLLKVSLRVLLVGGGVLLVYWLLPEKSYDNAATVVLTVVGGLVLWTLFVFRELLSISHAEYPLMRLSAALIATIALLVVAFANVDLALYHYSAANFSQPLSKMSALYFSMTVTSTVGFGDIVPVSDVARGVVTVQMFVNLVLLAAAIRGLVSVAQSKNKTRQLLPNATPAEAADAATPATPVTPARPSTPEAASSPTSPSHPEAEPDPTTDS